MAGPTRGDGEGPDPAVALARRVVGLYGDPTVSWSILLELDVAEPVAASDLERRLGDLVARSPHLGRVPDVVVGPVSWDAVRTRFAAERFADRAPLLRIAVSADHRRLLVAAHHGAVDGLGLLGVVAELVGLPLGSTARGLPRTGAEPGFVTGTLRRLTEIVWQPPERFASTSARPRAKGRGEVVAVRELPALRRGTAALAWSALVALRTWNGARRRGRRPVAAIGVSRRSGSAPLAPVRDTAFSRLDLRGARNQADVAGRLASTPPEPDFPEREGGLLGRAVSRLLVTVLGTRLGSSFLASNLGHLSGADGVTAARFWPAPSGPAGLAFGLVTVDQVTALTVRTRQPWFDDEDTARILALTAHALLEAQ